MGGDWHCGETEQVDVDNAELQLTDCFNPRTDQDKMAPRSAATLQTGGEGGREGGGTSNQHQSALVEFSKAGLTGSLAACWPRTKYSVSLFY